MYNEIPIQFIALSYVALYVFDYINNHKDLSNGQLNIDHFLYYFRAGWSSENNRPLKSPVKKGQKADKGKVVADEHKDKWLIK